ncbi:MAG: acylphosphatase [Opitutaceae bacterium]|nr:acylphosphatase [Opitutaceae bacterium]
MSSLSPIARAEVHFTGHVQGVGFRYSVMQVARGYEVSGVVENLADGRVRLVAEGERSEVDAFIAAVGERMHGYIRKTERTDSAGARQHEGFVIQ